MDGSLVDALIASVVAVGWRVERPLPEEPAGLALRKETPGWGGQPRVTTRVLDLTAFERLVTREDVERVLRLARAARAVPTPLGGELHLATVVGADREACALASLSEIEILFFEPRSGGAAQVAVRVEALELIGCVRQPKLEDLWDLDFLANGALRVTGRGLQMDLLRILRGDPEPGVELTAMDDGRFEVVLRPAYFGAEGLAVQHRQSLRRADGARITCEREELFAPGATLGEAVAGIWRDAGP